MVKLYISLITTVGRAYYIVLPLLTCCPCAWVYVCFDYRRSECGYGADLQRSVAPAGTRAGHQRAQNDLQCLLQLVCLFVCVSNDTHWLSPCYLYVSCITHR